MFGIKKRLLNLAEKQVTDQSCRDLTIILYANDFMTPNTPETEKTSTLNGLHKIGAALDKMDKGESLKIKIGYQLCEITRSEKLGDFEVVELERAIKIN